MAGAHGRARRAPAPAALLLGVLAATSCAAEDRGLRLATTTSVDQSGLLEAVLPAFTREAGVAVQVLAVGSGRAMQILRRGDADAAITHDPGAERALLAEAPVILYRKLMFNDFLLVGPGDDPAGARGASSVVEAMQRVARSEAPFASRGDRSGTHARERRLWELAGVQLRADRLLEAGQGMTATLRLASERRAYTLADRATFALLRHDLALHPVFEGGPDLLNTYAIIVMAGDREAEGRGLADWLSHGEGRDRIAAFAVKDTRPFLVWPRDRPGDRPEDLP